MWADVFVRCRREGRVHSYAECWFSHCGDPTERLNPSVYVPALVDTTSTRQAQWCAKVNRQRVVGWWSRYGEGDDEEERAAAEEELAAAEELLFAGEPSKRNVTQAVTQLLRLAARLPRPLPARLRDPRVRAQHIGRQVRTQGSHEGRNCLFGGAVKRIARTATLHSCLGLLK